MGLKPNFNQCEDVVERPPAETRFQCTHTLEDANVMGEIAAQHVFT
jgi:hypothetical protein